MVEALVRGLRRDFALTILDLPSVWTAWTNHALQLADRIVMVTHLSVAHVHLVRRQLSILSLQNLDSLPLTLVCNAVTGDQQNLLSIKAAERALGRPFDIVLPEEGRVMGAAVNQGLALSEVRRGTKLEKSVAQLADLIQADALVTSHKQR
jgi:pilus assembly protein CpaE